jgi:PAS domain S-box-containing protein
VDDHQKTKEQLLAELIELRRQLAVSGSVDTRKQKEELSQNQDRFRALIEHSADAIAMIDARGNVLYENPSVTKISGFSVEQRIGKNGFETIFPEDLPIVQEKMAELMTIPGGVVTAQFRSVKKDGTLWWAEAVAANYLHEPALQAIVINYRDISERKAMEQALRENQEQLDIALHAAQMGAWRYDILADKFYADKQACFLFGIDSDMFHGNPDVILNIAHPDDRQRIEDAFMHAIEQGVVYEDDYRAVWQDGSIHYIASRGKVEKDEVGQPEAIIGIVWEITERKQMEEALRKSQESYRSFVSQSHEAIYCTEFDQPIDTSLPVEEQIDIIYQNAFMGECNQAMVDIYGLPSIESLVGQRLIDFHRGKDNPVNRATFRKFIESNYRTVNSETEEVTPDGEKRYFISSDIGIVENGRLLRIWGTAADITRRKLAEEQQKLSLAEKETLLRELYHRTKNNMQVICAMLDLQAEYINDHHLKEALKATQNRIYSMALVHQKLYQSQNLSRVNLAEYFEQLARLILTSYEIPSSQVAVEFQMDDVFISVDAATPCGLILNELITNSLKHAFPEGRRGKILIQLSQTSDKEITLRVADDGVGFPAGFDIQKSNKLGLTIIQTLGKQLKGEITFTGSPGVSFQIKFVDNQYKARV